MWENIYCIRDMQQTYSFFNEVEPFINDRKDPIHVKLKMVSGFQLLVVEVGVKSKPPK
jgi:hypothetical protein